MRTAAAAATTTTTTTTTKTTLVLTVNFQEHLDKPVPECQTILDFDAARDDGGCSGDNWNSLRRANLRSNRHHHGTDIQFFTGQMPFLVPKKNWRIYQENLENGEHQTIHDYATARETMLIAVVTGTLKGVYHLHLHVLGGQSYFSPF